MQCLCEISGKLAYPLPRYHFYKNMAENCRRQHCQLTYAYNALRPANIDVSALCVSVYVIFA